MQTLYAEGQVRARYLIQAEHEPLQDKTELQSCLDCPDLLLTFAESSLG